MQITSMKEKRFEGIPVSAGIARGEALVSGKFFVEPEMIPIQEGEVASELQRLREALELTKQQLIEMQQRLSGSQIKSEEVLYEDLSAEAWIFEAHLLVLEDQAILNDVSRGVKERLVCVDVVYYEAMNRQIQGLRKLQDTYFKDRALDIRDVTERVLRNLKGIVPESSGEKLQHIVVAHDLTPSETMSFHRDLVQGMVTETGSQTSHTAILARSLGIPAIVGVEMATEEIRTGDHILIDGYRGLLVLNPTPETLEEYRKLESVEDELESKIAQEQQLETITLDGQSVTLSANIEFVEEAQAVLDSHANGVGLFRTEFIHLDNPTMSEDALVKVYSRVVSRLSPARVIFRTLDLGGDKVEPELFELHPEPNPFLGWRGIRISLARPEEFKVQLRAILRAAKCGNAGLMFPMVAGPLEVRKAIALLDEAREELRVAGIPYGENLEVGAMIEIPSAALTADMIAPMVDFMSIGTNDLVQYTLAVDRLNERVAERYDPYHPSILRLIRTTVEAGRANGAWVGVCGEAAGDVALLPALVGIGVDEFSVTPSLVGRVNYALRRLDTKRCQELAQECLQRDSAISLRDACRELAREIYPELLN